MTDAAQLAQEVKARYQKVFVLLREKTHDHLQIVETSTRRLIAWFRTEKVAMQLDANRQFQQKGLPPNPMTDCLDMANRIDASLMSIDPAIIPNPFNKLRLPFPVVSRIKATRQLVQGDIKDQYEMVLIKTVEFFDITLSSIEATLFRLNHHGAQLDIEFDPNILPEAEAAETHFLEQKVFIANVLKKVIRVEQQMTELEVLLMFQKGHPITITYIDYFHNLNLFYENDFMTDEEYRDRRIQLIEGMLVDGADEDTVAASLEKQKKYLETIYFPTWDNSEYDYETKNTTSKPKPGKKKEAPPPTTHDPDVLGAKKKEEVWDPTSPPAGEIRFNPQSFPGVTESLRFKKQQRPTLQIVDSPSAPTSSAPASSSSSRVATSASTPAASSSSSSSSRTQVASQPNSAPKGPATATATSAAPPQRTSRTNSTATAPPPKRAPGRTITERPDSSPTPSPPATLSASSSTRSPAPATPTPAPTPTTPAPAPAPARSTPAPAPAAAMPKGGAPPSSAAEIEAYKRAMIESYERQQKENEEIRRRKKEAGLL